MTNDEKIREVATKAVEDLITSYGHKPYKVPEEEFAYAILTALRASGYVIEPDWSSDMDAAPRDGTPIYVKNDRGHFVAAWHEHGPDCCLDEFWHVSNGKEWRDLRGSLPTHWKPITPPQERESE